MRYKREGEVSENGARIAGIILIGYDNGERKKDDE
jgi:hypothetical protein